VYLYIHSLIGLHGVVLNWLSIGTTLHFTVTNYIRSLDRLKYKENKKVIMVTVLVVTISKFHSKSNIFSINSVAFGQWVYN
jgi:hypothetical protein